QKACGEAPCGMSWGVEGVSSSQNRFQEIGAKCTSLIGVSACQQPVLLKPPFFYLLFAPMVAITIRSGKSPWQLPHGNLPSGLARRRPRPDMASPRYPIIDQHVSITTVLSVSSAKVDIYRVAPERTLRSLCLPRVVGKGGKDVAAPGPLVA
ncbi:hypothetical protein, partial [Burkholderia metallica]|uniref:hypothetical protein n=1 Tax=Burkholderia metallica TaxID=488729 RepID=UPI001C2D409B